MASSALLDAYRLQIRVETASGWKTKGHFIGGGPFVAEDRVYELDLNDVPGDILRIKLTPPAEFWMINCLAVDYSVDCPVRATEIQAQSGVDSSGQDILSFLAETDGRYLAMPNIGDWAELNFKAPAPIQSLTRSVFLKASGYYDIHLHSEGPCRMDILSRLLTEPGFAVRYSLGEYKKWQAEIFAQQYH